MQDFAVLRTIDGELLDANPGDRREGAVPEVSVGAIMMILVDPRHVLNTNLGGAPVGRNRALAVVD